MDASAIAAIRASQPPAPGRLAGTCIKPDAAIELMVSVEVPLVVDEVKLIELELSEHVGMSLSPDFEPATLQVRLTAPEKPPLPVTLIVEVDDEPGETDEGEAVVAVTPKLPLPLLLPVTVRVDGLELLEPKLPSPA